MTSPQVDMSCLRCFDLQCSRHRLEVELARVVVENEHLRLRHRELLAMCGQLREETRRLRASAHEEVPSAASDGGLEEAV